MKYALLNGGKGDFCIDLKPEEDQQIYNSFAWSSNTKNYVTVQGRDVIIYNWLKSSSERIEKHYVENNIDRFYNYLTQQTYATGNDVVPFILNLFRKMRNLTRETQTPRSALNLLYTLLLSLDEDVNHLDYDKWGISNATLPDQFDFFIEELKGGVAMIKPDLEVILRHCAGPIFQEAHRVVQTFFPDRDLFGDVSSRLITSEKGYSSAHYTPQYVARGIVEQCLKYIDLQKDRITIFDPACGSAEFLMEALKQLQDKHYAGIVCVRGWDSSESAVSTSKFLLHYEKETQWHEKLQIDIRQVNDSLQEDWRCDTDILLMNPPFVSWELLSVSQREVVAGCLSTKITKPNQAIAFFQKAIHSLLENGVLGCVMPTTLFTTESYDDIRKQLQEVMSSRLVAKLGNFVFDNALTDVSLYVGHKPKTIMGTRLLWSSNERGVAQEAICALRKMEANNLREVDKGRYSIYVPVDYPDVHGSWKVTSLKDTLLRAQLDDCLQQGNLVRLKTIFTVRQGIRTGNNGAFIIGADEYEMMSTDEQKFYRKSIDNDAISYGKLEAKHYVWYPYSQEGLLVQSEEQLAEKAPMTYNRLLNFKRELINRSSLNNKKWWWMLSRHRDWLLEKKCRLVSTEFGNSKSFALDAKGDCVIERGYAWIPKKEMKIEDEDYYFYLAFFVSSLFEKMLSIYTKQLAGGAWYDLSAKYTHQIPILDVRQKGKRESKMYHELVMLGKMASEEGAVFFRDRIDEVVYNYIEYNL